MATVKVTYKYSDMGKTPSMTSNCRVNVSSSKPTESEVLAELRKSHPKTEFLILKIEP